MFEKDYGGLKFGYDGQSVVFSRSELNQILFDLAEQHSSSIPVAQRSAITSNLGKRDIVLGGPLSGWQVVAENLKQLKNFM